MTGEVLQGLRCEHFELWSANPGALSDMWGCCHPRAEDYDGDVTEKEMNECIGDVFVEIPISEIKEEFDIDFENGGIPEEYLERGDSL